MGIKICGVGAFSPERAVRNADFESIMDTSDEWISTRTGIHTRRYSQGESTFELGAKSATEALRDAGIEASQVGLIIATTITGDFFCPSLACMVQREIGAQNAAAFDVNAACSGFIYALDTARRFLETDKNLEYVLVTASDRLSAIVDFNDRATAILFGDGSASVVVTRGESASDIYGSFLGADGTGASSLYGKHCYEDHPFGEQNHTWESEFPGKYEKIIQDGKEVYKFAVRVLPIATEKAVTAAGLTLSDIDFFIPHQANLRIIQAAAKSMDIPLERFYVNIENHGNTSGVTIPLALYEGVKSGAIKRGDKICLVGFGAGLTYGSIVFEF